MTGNSHTFPLRKTWQEMTDYFKRQAEFSSICFTGFILARDLESPWSYIIVSWFWYLQDMQANFLNARESWNRKIFRFRWVYFVQSYYFQRKIAREVTIFTIDILSFLYMWDTMNGLLQFWWNKGAAILRTPSVLKYSKTFSLSLIPAFLILQLSHTTLGRTIQTIINCHNERSSAWLWLNIHAKEVKHCRQDKFGRRFKIGQISRYPCPQNWRKSPEHTGEKAKAQGNKRSLALRAKSRKTLLT